MKKDKLHIHWYPGHIAKAEKQLKEKLSLVDAVIEVIDARLPMSTSFDNIARLLGQKPRLILLNKSDLVNQDELNQFINVIKLKTGYPVLQFDTKFSKATNLVISKTIEISEPAIQAVMQKGLLRRPARIMVVGMPNVGKSSVINKLTKSSKTKTGAKAGVTRQQQWVRINPKLELLDTPGIIQMKQDNQERAKKLAFINAVSDNAYDNESIALELLKILDSKYPNSVKDFYKVDDLNLHSIAIARNWIKSAGCADVERTACYILKDFRDGKIGKFILDEI